VETVVKVVVIVQAVLVDPVAVAAAQVVQVVAVIVPKID